MSVMCLYIYICTYLFIFIYVHIDINTYRQVGWYVYLRSSWMMVGLHGFLCGLASWPNHLVLCLVCLQDDHSTDTKVPRKKWWSPQIYIFITRFPHGKSSLAPPFLSKKNWSSFWWCAFCQELKEVLQKSLVRGASKVWMDGWRTTRYYFVQKYGYHKTKGTHLRIFFHACEICGIYIHTHLIHTHPWQT